MISKDSIKLCLAVLIKTTIGGAVALAQPAPYKGAGLYFKSSTCVANEAMTDFLTISVFTATMPKPLLIGTEMRLSIETRRGSEMLIDSRVKKFDQSSGTLVELSAPKAFPWSISMSGDPDSAVLTLEALVGGKPSGVKATFKCE